MSFHHINFKLIAKYIFVGSLVALFQILTFLLLFKVLDIMYLISSTVAFVLTVIFSFIVQRAVVFRVEGKRAVQTSSAFSIIFLNSLLGLGVNCLIMYGGVEYLYDSATQWQLVSMVIISLYNFFFYRYLFRPQSIKSI